MNTTQHTNGYSLIEVLIAIAILLLALVGPMTIAAKGIQSAAFVREQTTAMFLAQEGIEAFIASRNEATIEAFAAGNLATSWDWIASATRTSSLDSCFTANGCNIDFSVTDPLSTVQSCGADGAGCELYFDATKTRARYSMDSNGTPTSFTRVIRLSELLSGDGVKVHVTVYWNSRLFGASEQEMTLTSTLYNLYD